MLLIPFSVSGFPVVPSLFVEGFILFLLIGLGTLLKINWLQMDGKPTHSLTPAVDSLKGQSFFPQAAPRIFLSVSVLNIFTLIYMNVLFFALTLL